MVAKRTGHKVKADEIKSDLDYFAIAGEDNVFHWAKAKIDGDTVLVWHDDLKTPKHVRYAWEANPDGCNLYNKDGWPTTPFRSDSLPYSTKDRELPFSTKGRFFMTH